jgi:ABC-type arginine transport system permease subunit
MKKFSKLSITTMIIGILTLLSSPIILILVFGISWALADSTEPPKMSDLVTLYSIIISGFLLAVIPIILGSIDLVKMKQRDFTKKEKRMDIAGIVLGTFTVGLNVIYLLLYLFNWSI